MTLILIVFEELDLGSDLLMEVIAVLSMERLGCLAATMAMPDLEIERRINMVVVIELSLIHI